MNLFFYLGLWNSWQGHLWNLVWWLVIQLQYWHESFFTLLWSSCFCCTILYMFWKLKLWGNVLWHYTMIFINLTWKYCYCKASVFFFEITFSNNDISISMIPSNHDCINCWIAILKKKMNAKISPINQIVYNLFVYYGRFLISFKFLLDILIWAKVV